MPSSAFVKARKNPQFLPFVNCDKKIEFFKKYTEKSEGKVLD